MLQWPGRQHSKPIMSARQADFAGQRDSGLLLSLQSWTDPGRRDMGDCRNHVPSRPSLTCVLPFALLVISLLVSITAEIQACLSAGGAYDMMHLYLLHSHAVVD